MENKRATVRETVATLASDSNAHGIAKIATTRSSKRRVFWSLLVVLACIAVTIQLVSLVQKYLSYPVVEVTKTIRPSKVTFPAVTVCNKNPISMTKLNNLLAKNSEVSSWFSFIGQADFGEHNSRMNSPQATYENFPKLDTQFGHSFESLVLNCRFNNQECGIDDFSHFFDSTDYYNCFTFNARNDNQSKMVNRMKPGPHHGLSLILSLDKSNTPSGSYGLYDMKDNLAYSGGIRAQIHPSNELPTPGYYGFDVPPGYSTEIGLKTSSYSRLQSPYGDCTSEKLDGLPQHENTMFTCSRVCQQKLIVEKCGCKTSALPMEQSDVSNTNIPFCSEIKNWQSKAQNYMDGKTVELPYLKCEKEILESFNSDKSYESSCRCSAPCSETSYQRTVSMAYWPEEFYQFSLLRTIYQNANNATSDQVKKALDTMSYIYTQYGTVASTGIPVDYNRSDAYELAHASATVRKSLLRLNIYLQDLSVMEHTQVAEYTLADLFTDIGVTLILWMGVSVLTIMEVFELIMALIFLACGSDIYVMGDKKREDDTDEKQDRL